MYSRENDVCGVTWVYIHARQAEKYALLYVRNITYDLRNDNALPTDPRGLLSISFFGLSFNPMYLIYLPFDQDKPEVSKVHRLRKWLKQD